MINKPLVSVCLITYNHKEFISQAIEGILAQKTEFSFELVIGEDCSKDSTRKICEEYAKAHPKIVNLLASEKNLGMSKNFTRTLFACRGVYIALCDGDDYWTDPLKLQKQVDFLEKNESFAITHHKTSIWKNGNIIDDPLNVSTPELSTINQLAKGNYIRTLSVVFRNPKTNSFFTQLPNCPIGDFPLYISILDHFRAKIKYFPETMGVYRLNEHGTYESKSSEYKRNTYGETIEALLDSSILKICEVVQTLKTKHHNIYWNLYKREKNEPKRLYYLQKSIKYSDKNIKALLKTIDIIHSSLFFKIYNKIKKFSFLVIKKV